MDKINSVTKQLKQLLAGKKARMTAYVIGVLWIAVIMQLLVNSLYRKEGNILEAFIGTNSEVSSFELEMTGNYGSGYLSDADKKELVLYIASKIGLQIDQEVIINSDRNSEVYIKKSGKNAETLIKVISMEEVNESGIKEINHYILVRLKIYKNMDSILSYRELLKDIYGSLGAVNIQSNMQLTANYQEKLSLNEMNSIADGMIENLEGKVAYANRQENMFTIYAYSGLLDEYVTSVGTKINIHIAINYDEKTNTTNVYLGTPVINGGY